MKLITTILSLITTTAFAQGPLTPPGAPAPTMKTLDEIHAKVADAGEKRTPISSLPFTINQPGSYYLANNLSTALAVDGISIDAKNVTIDLNGFRMTGNGSGKAAINITNANVTTETLVVKNGTMTGWQTAIDGNSASIIAGSIEGVSIRDGNGIQLGFAKNVVLSKCTLENCSGVSGYTVKLGNDCTISECRMTNLSFGNIQCGFRSIIRDTNVDGTNVGIDCGTGSHATNCTISGVGGNAFVAGNSCTVSGCVVTGDFSGGLFVLEKTLVENCTVNLTGSPFSGITLFRGSRVINSIVQGSSVGGALGIHILDDSMVENVTVTGFDVGISTNSRCVIRNAKVQGALSTNISVGSDTKVTDCQVASAPVGINGGARCIVSKNAIRGNTTGLATGTGIQVSGGGTVVIEANEIIACATGISVSTTSNMIFRNTLRFNVLPLSIVGGNEVGPTGTPSTATSPFANLVY